MPYTRIIQSGHFTEIYTYQKNYVRSNQQNIERKRRTSSDDYDDLITFQRRVSSIRRARSSLIRLVEANLIGDQKPSFLTLTIEREVSLAVGYKYLTSFWSLVKRHGYRVRYIGVPEWQKRGALHFHFLVWGFSREDCKRERSTRNIQRLWYRGFVDIRYTKYVSLGLAGYIAKYLTKTLMDRRLGNRRAYTTSRNVFRPLSAGSNSLADYTDQIIDPGDNDIVKISSYDTLWLGQCHYKKIIKKKCRH